MTREEKKEALLRLLYDGCGATAETVGKREKADIEAVCGAMLLEYYPTMSAGQIGELMGKTRVHGYHLLRKGRALMVLPAWSNVVAKVAELAREE